MLSSLLLEDLSRPQAERLRAILAQTCQASPLPDVYWWPLPTQGLSLLQHQHQAKCGPYRLALLLEKNDCCLKMELLLRAENSLHCACIAALNQDQLALAWAFWHQLDEALRGLDSEAKNCKEERPVFNGPSR
jgi:hypothetical protein